MAMYESFAQVYDKFMDNVPYDSWSRQLCRILSRYGIDDGLVLDLGCGTGQMTRRLRDRGYDMIGVDGSEDMLQVAMEHEQGRGDILYLLQDMRAFELYGTVRAVCSCCDCLNYLESEEDLLTVFKLVENYLDPGGIFVFDMNTAYYYEHELAQNVFADVREECTLIWENDYHPDLCENEYDLTIFARLENGLYQRTSETHVERAYPMETVKRLAEEAGLIFQAAFDGYSERPLAPDSSRMLLVFRESGRKLCGQTKSDSGLTPGKS